jgi:hypothetical protein
MGPLDGQLETYSQKAKTTVLIIDRFAAEQGLFKIGSGFQIKLWKIEKEEGASYDDYEISKTSKIGYSIESILKERGADSVEIAYVIHSKYFWKHGI